MPYLMIVTLDIIALGAQFPLSRMGRGGCCEVPAEPLSMVASFYLDVLFNTWPLSSGCSGYTGACVQAGTERIPCDTVVYSGIWELLVPVAGGMVYRSADISHSLGD